MRAIKKTVCLFLTVLLMMSAMTPVMADDEISIVVYGNKLELDVSPEIVNGRTMVPLRAIFEALGATVKWDGELQLIEASKSGRDIELRIGKQEMEVEYDTIYLDSPPYIKEGRTLVPVRAIAEAFGNKVEWNEKKRTVLIDNNFVVPKLNYEYGPMTLERLSGNRIYSTSHLSSLKFTKCDLVDLTYALDMNVKGVSDRSGEFIDVYFYDKDDTVLEQITFILNVQANTEFNVKVSKNVSRTVIENAARIAFFTRGGNPAIEYKTSVFDKKGSSNVDENKKSNDNSIHEDTNTDHEDIEEQIEIIAPKLNYNYGPMTLKRYYSSDRLWCTNKISSLTFTKCEKSFSSYDVEINMKGIIDDDITWVNITFYDKDGNSLGTEKYSQEITPNEKYNVVIHRYISQNIIENATSIEFASYSNNKAIYDNLSDESISEDENAEGGKEQNNIEDIKENIYKAKKYMSESDYYLLTEEYNIPTTDEEKKEYNNKVIKNALSALPFIEEASKLASENAFLDNRNIEAIKCLYESCKSVSERKETDDTIDVSLDYASLLALYNAVCEILNRI